PEDAERAASIGCDGVVVSNHGGRQLDGAAPTLDALPNVARAVASRMTVLLDGGVRRGVDILKARALGAHGVLTGRATLFGAMAEIAHTASQPLCASALEAMKAPTALPLQTLTPKIVLERLRASAASELTTVWFATIAARRPQSRSAAPMASAAGHQAPNANT